MTNAQVISNERLSDERLAEKIAYFSEPCDLVSAHVNRGLFLSILTELQSLRSVSAEVVADNVPIAATEDRPVDWVDVTGWGVFNGHAIPVDVARFIAEKINLYAAYAAAPQPVSAEPVAWRCAACSCKTYARVDERKPDGGFGPGDLVRCVNCKTISTTAPLRYFAAPQPTMLLSEDMVERAAKAAFRAAQTKYRAEYDHFPLKQAWETTSDEVRKGWRDIARAALQASASTSNGGEQPITVKAVWDFFYGEKRGDVTPEEFAEFLSQPLPPIPTNRGEGND